MYTSGYEVIENLINVVGHNMTDSYASPEEWLEAKLSDEGVTPWEKFAEEHDLGDYGDFDELESAWNDYKDSFMDEAWNLSEIEDAVEEEVSEVWTNMTDYLDTEDKYNMILRLA